ncbi:MAG: amidohydrolase family protein, partial [Verrucomicrobiota bacterium]|nr:amidohydrolase family protein [Verrucomicrobiota bacterium]
PPMTIDVHTHTFPDGIAARALEKLAAKAGHAIAPVSNGTVSDLLEQLQRDGVDKAVVCPIATKPSQFDGILAEALALRDGERGQAAAEHLVPLASVHPADDARFAHLKQVAESGIRGVKLHPYYQDCVLDTPDLLEYFRCCRDLGLVVQCHCGFDIGFPFDPICGPERIARVLKEVPGLAFIAAHLGGWRQWGGVAEHLLGKDVFLDTAVIPPDLGDAAAQRILREHPADKLLFATDWPWLTFKDGINFVRSVVRDETAQAGILGGNAARLLRL